MSENGYGKRSAVDDYRITNRGGKGVKTINVTEKTGNLISLKNVTDNDDLMVINKSGVTIRIGVDTLRVMGRATQGVKLIRLRDGDAIASVAKVSKWEEDDNISEEELIENETIIKSPAVENTTIENNNDKDISDSDDNDDDDDKPKIEEITEEEESKEKEKGPEYSEKFTTSKV